MKQTSKQLFIYSLSAVALLSASAGSASQDVSVPTFEGGLTADIGTFYAVPSANDTTFLSITTSPDNGDTDITTFQNLSGEYDWGFEAALGYLIEDTANGIELSYRGINTDASTHRDVTDDTTNISNPIETINESLKFELNSLDLMLSQYINIGQFMQLRLSAGASYVRLDQTQDLLGKGPSSTDTRQMADPAIEELIDFTEKSNFKGFGPRLGMDARYGFGQGFGIVAGASLAYLLGDLELTSDLVTSGALSAGLKADTTSQQFNEDFDNQAVTNLRGNIGLDYVYFFENEAGSTLGLELGYLVDYYADAAYGFNQVQVRNLSSKNTANIGGTQSASIGTTSITFSGPYLNLKGVF